MTDIELTATMMQDCRNINDNYDFYDLLVTHTGPYFSRDKSLYWFEYLWEYIPEEHLYQLYKELLSDIHIAKGRNRYTVFFQPKILEAIAKFNKNDTVENQTLNSLLDDEGYLTVYLGHSKKTLHNCNSWALNKEDAINLGRTRALLDKNNPVFYCVTGKVKLDEVLSFINVRGREEIIILQRNVKNKTKEFLNSADIDLKPWWSSWA